MAKKERDNSGKILACGLLIAITAWAGFLRADDILAHGQVAVLGVSLRIDPASQTAPVNTPTIVNTIFSAGSGAVPAGMTVKGELRGPGITGAITLSTLPGHPFAIAGLPLKGTYTLSDIRLEKDGKSLMRAVPDKAVIGVADVIITEVKTRPLTLEEIREKGIVITEENFSVYTFSIGLLVESNPVHFEMPVIFTPQGMKPVSNWGGGDGLGGFDAGGLEPFTLTIPQEETDIDDSVKNFPNTSIAGLLVFNNKIGFLNQFFSAMFIISNNAPSGSPLALKDLQATITLPEGLREAKTNPPHIVGTPIPVRCPGPDGKIGTADDVDVILATFSGMSEFLAEGLKEGTHTIKIDFSGTLTGMPAGDTVVKGSAMGAVLVRNPEFSVVFSHPDVVRSGEEYDMFMTLTNTARVNANLVSLTLPKARLIGTELLSAERVEWETILPGESQVAKFHMRSKQTGKVRATAFQAEGSVRGQFILTAGVGEQGIPLSPDTLVLPAYAFKVPANVLEIAMLLLGEAYSIAQSPAGLLPENVPVIKKETVKTRSIELIEAGQRIEFGEAILPAMEVFLLDWLGNRSNDLPFDQLRRLTTKGSRLAAAIGEFFNEALKTVVLENFQKELTQTAYYKKPFFSAALAANGPVPACHLLISDALANRLGALADETVREIPYGEFFRLPGNGATANELGLVGVFDNNGYRVEVRGAAAGTYDLFLAVPDLAGNFRQVVFNHVECRANSVAWVDVNAAAGSFVLSNDLNHDGVADATVNGSVVSLARPSLQLIAAIQDCVAHDAGHAVALFFNQALDAASTQALANYSCASKKVLSAQLQPSQRVVLVGLDNPISPFVESRIRVSGLKDTIGQTMEPASVELPIRATIKTPGGIVFGTVLTAAGAPVANAAVQLVDYDSAADSLSISTVHSDAGGNYQFDFVRMLRDPFTITVKDPASGKIEKIRTVIRSHGQRLRIDVIMRGRASLGGRVLLQDGVTPVAGAYVKANAENAIDSEFSTVRTDSAGEFMISDIPLGRINLFAIQGNAMGYQTAALSVPGEIGRTEILIYPGQTGSVSGRVLANDGVTVIPGIPVLLFRSGGAFAQAITGAEGNFVFSGIPTGDFSLQVKNPLNGEPSGFASGAVRADQTTEVTIIMNGSGSVSGRVLAFDGTPCPGVIVYLLQTPFHSETDANGEFVLDGIPTGSYSIQAVDQAGNRETSAQVRLVSEGQQVRATLVFPNTATGGISGKAYLASGAPAVDAEVILADGNFMIKGRCRSKNDGSFAFSNLKAGGYVLVARKGSDGGEASAALQYAGHFLAKDIRFCGLGNVRVNTFAADGLTPVMADVVFEFSEIVVEEGDKIGIWGAESRANSGANGQASFGNILARAFYVSAQNAFYPGGAYAQGKVPANGTEVVANLVFKPTGKVQGKVVGPDGVTAVANAKIIFRAKTLPAQELNADANGEFIFTLVPPGSFAVEAEDTINGYRGSLDGSMGSEGQTIQVIVRLKGRGEVYGQVKTLQGALVANAQVTIRTIGFPNETFTGAADSQGEFRFGGIPEGDLALTAKDPVSLLGGRAQGTLAGNNTQVRIDVVLEPAARVTGRVRDVDGLNAIAGAQVILYHERNIDPYGVLVPFGYFVSDPDGRFDFLYVPKGNFYVDVFAQASGRKGRKWGKIITDNQTVDIDVLLEARGTVKGIFYDGSGMVPIPGAEVKIQSNGNYPFITQTTSDDEGGFRFDQIARGSFKIDAKDEATGRAGTVSGQVEYEEQIVQADVRAKAAGIVKGQVFQAGGTTIAAYARVTLKAVGKTSAVNAGQDGNYLIDYVPLGAFTVYASEQNGRDAGSAAGRLDFHGQEATANITFNGLGIVNGTVKDSLGAPLVDITVKISCANGENFATATDATGAFSFPDIRVGAFDVSARHPVSGLGATASGKVSQNDETVSLALVLESAGNVKGVVLQADGVAPAMYAVGSLSNGSSTFYRTIPADGSFAFHSIRLGSYTLKVLGMDDAGLFRTVVLLQTHNETIDLGPIVLDNQIPQVSSILPGNGASAVSLGTAIAVTFSEAMDAASLGNAFSLTGRQGKVAGTMTVAPDGKSLVFQSTAPLTGFSSYTAAVAATAEDAAGNQLGEPVSVVFATLDNVPPLVQAIDPVNNKIQVAVDAPINVTFSEAIDTAKFGAANFLVTRNGAAAAGTISFASGGSVAVFTPAGLEANSVYAVTVRNAVDFSGNTQAASFGSAFYTVDTIVPVLTLTPPSGGTTVKEGTLQTVAAGINGATDVSKVYFFINGELKYTDNAAPYQYSFSAPYISALGQDSFLLEALAVDQVGNQSERKSIQFALLVDTPPQITLSGPAAPQVLPRQAITCPVQAGDDIALKQINFKAVGGNLNYQNVKSLNQISYSYTYAFSVPADIAPGTVITVSAEAVDSRGSKVSATNLVLSVPEDNQAPQVQMAEPAAGAKFNYNQAIAITALASDDVGVKQVSFYIDGQLLSSDDTPPFAATHTAPPYEEDTPMVIRAEALDSAGKTAAADVTVIILRLVDPEAPTVKVTSPSNGALVYPEENLKITASAADKDSAVSKVEFFVDGTLLSEDTTAPYEAQYAVPAGLADGTEIKVRAKAWDESNKSAFDEVTVSVLNGTLIPAGTVISATDTQYDNKSVIIRNGTVTINGSHSFLNMIVSESGIVTHSAATASTIYKSDLYIAGKLSIDSTSKINVGGRGYLGAHQGGNNESTGRTLGNVAGSGSYSGGSHGGYGGKYGVVNGLYGSLYDPNDPGSGGGYGNAYGTYPEGGNGGGVARIEANELVLDGSISAGGASTSNGGAGSGGSVKIKVNSLSGSGTITADGGSSSSGGYGSGGGGGRVAIYYEDMSGFTLVNIHAYGGEHTYNSSTAYNGGAGTVYLQKNSEAGELIINNRGLSSGMGTSLIKSPTGTITEIYANELVDGSAAFVVNSLVGMELLPDKEKTVSFTIVGNSATEIFTDPADGDMTLAAEVGDRYDYRYGGNLNFTDGQAVLNGEYAFANVNLNNATLTVNGTLNITNDLILQGASILNHSVATTAMIYSLDVKVGNRLSIGSSSKINVGGRGYLGAHQGGNTENSGRTLGNVAGSGSYSGGSHGGYGGKYAVVNGLYGSLYDPNDPGSGGGYGNAYGTYPEGGNGGGVARIEANELVLDGSISAGGASTSNGGAGSGGSVKIKVNSLSGSGTITADGGSSSGSSGSGGGGGRVAVYYEDISGFTLANIHAYGGEHTYNVTVAYNGGAGTVYLQKNGEAGEIVINNRGLSSSYATSLITSPSGTVSEIFANKLVDVSAAFVVNSLVGMELFPDKEKTASFTIVGNIATEIFTDPLDGDMTLVAAVGDRYDYRYGGNLNFTDGQAILNGEYVFANVNLNNATLTVNGMLNITNDLVLQGTSILNHSVATTTTIYSLDVKVGNRLSISSSSKINVGGRGYLGAHQGGNNENTGRTLCNVAGSGSYSGGSYGGYGGKHAVVNGLYGSLYDPSDPGSGGGYGNAYGTYPEGGNGGGVARIEANELVLDGSISAGGASTSNGGAGSGGSIKVKVNSLSGGGTITADGGSSSGGSGSGGGGGRVAVYYEDISGFTLANIHAYGGEHTYNVTVAYNGGAGTVYLQKNGEAGEMVVNNRAIQAGNPIIFPVISEAAINAVSANVLTNTNAAYMPAALIGMELIPDITNMDKTFTIIDNDATTITTDPGDGDLTQFTAVGKIYAGKMVFTGHMTIRNTIAEISMDIDLGNLSLVDNTIFRHPAATTTTTSYMNIKVVENIIIDTTSKINVGGRGYLGAHQGGNNENTGRTLCNVAGSGSYSGGSHGGYGGKYAVVNGLYGSLYDPSDPGSGGGYGNAYGTYPEGGNGGGVARIEANELVLDGSISAGGASTSNGGAGSGGSIKVKVNSLSGGGTITADGGSSSSSGYGSGGGGGRVAIYYEDISGFTLANIHAYGGEHTYNTSVAYNGGAGTVYLKAAAQEFGDLIVDNNNTATATTIYSTTLPAVGAGFNTALEEFRLTNSGAAWVPGALSGLELNPAANALTPQTFTIAANDSTTITTDPADGNMIDYAGGTGQAYIGEHHLFNLTVKGKARVFTYDRIKTAGLLTVEPGSALKAENVER